MSIKNFLGNPAYSTILFLIIFMFFSFKGCTKDSKNPIKDDKEDQSTVFSKPVDPTKIITVETASGGKMQVVGNIILVKTNIVTADIEELKIKIEQTGGELVGQIPNLGIYQVEYPFSTESELKTMIDNLNNIQEIEFATYNAFPKTRVNPHTKDYCKRDYDNHTRQVSAMVFFDEIGYFQAVPIMGLVREHMTLNKVKIAVADSRINIDQTHEFDDVQILVHLSDYYQGAPSDSHGTQVAGMIAADNYDGAVNGIASSLIENNLELLSVVNDTAYATTVMGDIETIYIVLSQQEVHIYNMSYGFGGIDKLGKIVNVKNIRKLYKDTFKYFPNVLFVVAASNEHYEINNWNDAPAGIQLNNVITVAGTKLREPEKACTWSAYGPLIDIAAPVEKVPVLDPTKANTLIALDGTSFATPAVASLAAVLKSIDPGLSPGEIKSYILNNSSSTAASIGGRRLVLPQPIEQLLIDMGAPDEILEKIDMSEPLGEWDLPGVVAARICNISTIKIDGEPIMECETSDTSNTGYIRSDTGLIVFSKGTQGLFLGFWNKYKILNSSLDIIEFYTGIENAVTVSYSNIDINHFVVGNSVSGTISIKNGFITERYPGTGHPMVIEAEGMMSGTMRMTVHESVEIKSVAFSGTMMITLLLWEGQSEEFYEYFEDNCD